MVRKIATALLVSASFAGIPMLGGCDREVSHEKTVSETPTGTTKVKEETVVKKADGTVEKKTEEKKVP